MGTDESYTRPVHRNAEALVVTHRQDWCRHCWKDQPHTFTPPDAWGCTLKVCDACHWSEMLEVYEPNHSDEWKAAK